MRDVGIFVPRRMKIFRDAAKTQHANFQFQPAYAG